MVFPCCVCRQSADYSGIRTHVHKQHSQFLFILVRMQDEVQANGETIGAEAQRRSRAKRDKKMAMMLVNMGSNVKWRILL